jgi:hypothetical protein
MGGTLLFGEMNRWRTRVHVQFVVRGLCQLGYTKDLHIDPKKKKKKKKKF